MESRTDSPDLLEICVDNLQKSFGDNHVLREVNLSVKRGEIVAIVGGSGGGKTVLLELLIRQLRPDSGRVLLADHESAGSPLVDLATLDEAELDRIRIHWAVVFQRNALLSGTVEENIALPLMLVKGLSEQQAHQRVREVLKAVNLDTEGILGKKRDKLSGGMAKRVAIARALAMDPLVVFYDEPTTGLDPESAKLIQQLISAAMSEPDAGGTQRTAVIVTHDKDLLYRLKPRVVMLNEGRVYFDGSYEMFAESDSAIIRPYFELMPILHGRAIPVV